jgi:hypothetical protein
LYAVIASVFFGKDMFVDIIKTLIGKWCLTDSLSKK